MSTGAGAICSVGGRFVAWRRRVRSELGKVVDGCASRRGALTLAGVVESWVVCGADSWACVCRQDACLHSSAARTGRKQVWDCLSGHEVQWWAFLAECLARIAAPLLETDLTQTTSHASTRFNTPVWLLIGGWTVQHLLFGTLARCSRCRFARRPLLP